MQVYQLAKKRGITTKELCQELKGHGFDVKTMSRLTDDMLKAIEIKEPEVEKSEEGFTPEYKNEPTPIPKAIPPDNGMKHYKAISERLLLGGYIPEQRGNGFFKPDEGIQFENHVFITDDKGKQAFIEGSDRFKYNDITLIDQVGYSNLMQNLAAKRTRMIEESGQLAGRSG